MPRFISLLRGINVSGKNPIRMANLKSLYESFGFTHVQTYVQSGNLVFDSTDTEPALVARQIETGIRQKFGFDIPVFIRDSNDFQRLADTNPFTHGRNEDPAKLHVTFLNRVPAELDLMKLSEFKDTSDEYTLYGREIFLFCPNGYGRTKLTNTFFENKLSVQATTRNWKTVKTLLVMANSI